MRILITNVSSMGDIVQTLPALSDASTALADIAFDWVVEKQYAEIPAWHSATHRVIPVPLQRWMREFYRLPTLREEWHHFIQLLRQDTYDYIIDPHGTIKNTLLATRARGLLYGMDKISARQPCSARFQHYPLTIDRGAPLSERVRKLFARMLKYALPQTESEYGVAGNRFPLNDESDNYLVFVHGTTQRNKEWPVRYWKELCAAATAAGYMVRLPWNSPREKQRALELAGTDKSILALPKLNLTALAGVLRRAGAVVSLNTGPGHLAVALGRPVICLYREPDPSMLDHSAGAPRHLYPAANKKNMDGIYPDVVWKELQKHLPSL